MMKKATVMENYRILAVAALAVVLAGCAPGTSRKEVVLSPGEFQVVVAPDVFPGQPAVAYAVQELTNFLSRTFSREIEVTSRPDAARTWIVLGSNDWSVATGISTADLPRDAFRIKTAPGRIFIAGHDDRKHPHAIKELNTQRGTLHGVYEFLERWAGVRMYFPGELGEVVPRRDRIAVPETDRVFSPDWIVRRDGGGMGSWYEPVSETERKRLVAVQRCRLRHQTEDIPCCHGQCRLFFRQRFAKTNPEYFLLRKDGTRSNDFDENRPLWENAQMCHSSDIWEEIYRDVRSYFLGESADVRKIPSRYRKGAYAWSWNASAGKYFDVMPQDAMRKCFCEKCQAAYAAAKDKSNYSTELIWGQTARVGRRLKDEGIPGTITMMAYESYKGVPETEIPDNVAVMICSNGSWVRPEREEGDFAMLGAWTNKLGHTVWNWHNTGKHACLNLMIRDAPGMTPHAFGRYYRKLAPYSFGCFCDNSQDRYMYLYLNYYIFHKVAWDNSVDTEAMIDEHHRLMFGPAEGPMRAFYGLLEKKWLGEIIGEGVSTSIGMATVSVSDLEIWRSVYGGETVSRLKALMDEATALTAAGSLERRRVELMRRELLDPILRKVRAYSVDGVADERRRRREHPPVNLIRGFKPVTISRTAYDRKKPSKTVNYKVDLKPGRTYRLSFFMKGENIVPQIPRGSGAQAVIWDAAIAGKGECLPKIGFTGTFDRVHCSGVFKTARRPTGDVKPSIDLRLFFATGTVEFDGLVLEEVKEDE